MSYYSYSREELRNGRIPVKLLGDSGEVFYELALEMVETIEETLGKDDFAQGFVIVKKGKKNFFKVELV